MSEQSESKTAPSVYLRRKKCTLPHCKTVILSSLDKLKVADKHVFTHGKLKTVSLVAVSATGEVHILFVKELEKDCPEMQSFMCYDHVYGLYTFAVMQYLELLYIHLCLPRSTILYPAPAPLGEHQGAPGQMEDLNPPACPQNAWLSSQCSAYTKNLIPRAS